MIRKIIFPIFVIVGCCGAISSNQNYHVSHRSGVVNAVDCVKMGQDTGFPLQNEECDLIAVTSETDSISISVGSNFGVEYEISNLSNQSCLKVTHRLDHPNMTRPDGIESTVYERSFRIGSCVGDVGTFRNVFSWYVEERWEAVRGGWVFAVIIDGKSVINETIHAN